MKEKDFNEVYAKHYPNVFKQAFRHFKGDITAAEDIAQKVFLTYYTKGHQYKGNSMLSVWLYSVCRNECNMYFRKKETRVLLAAKDVTELQDNETAKINPIEPISENFKRAFKKLPKLERQILIMTIEGYTTPEVGIILSLTIPAVKSRLHRARQKMKSLLSKPPKRRLIKMPEPKPEPKPDKKNAKIIEMPHRKGRPKPPRFYTQFYKKAVNE